MDKPEETAAADDEPPADYASPACFLHELDPEWTGLAPAPLSRQPDAGERSEPAQAGGRSPVASGHPKELPDH